MILEYFGILSGLVLLVVGADRFVTGAANIARRLGMPPLLIGLTIVSIATSAPEILVGSVAALDGKIDIAIGNAIGGLSVGEPAEEMYAMTDVVCNILPEDKPT